MITAAQARQSELDQVADTFLPSPELADDLFAVVGFLEAESGLRAAMSDPTASVDVRQQLATDVFASHVSADAVAIVSEAVGLRWNSGMALVDALERQGERVLLGSAQRRNALDGVEDEIFRFGRVVTADVGLQAALDDRQADVSRRQALVADLLDKKADPVTSALAQRAAAGRRGTYIRTIEAILEVVADVQQRAIARVTVATPLDATQAARLRAALAAQAGRPVTLDVVVDPAVVGGVRVLIGDDMIDGTVSGRMAAARRQLNADSSYRQKAGS